MERQMTGRRLIALLPLLLIPGCMSLDGFLFNTEKLTGYKLPGNTIPDSLIRQETFTSAGNTLYGYWVKNNSGRPGVTVLYCHGNKHSIDDYWDRVMFLHDLGVNVFVFDYRGFGMSGGTSSEQGLREDADAALAFIKADTALFRNSDTLCVYGYSLGCYPAIYLAGLANTGARWLIAESPFASSNSLTQSGLGGLDIPETWLTDGDFNNAENIKKITCPLLLFHGEIDDFVRYRDNGKIVFENAPDRPKVLVLVPGAVHTNVPQTLGEAVYLQKIQAFFALPPNP
jgi:uncharacterized protein